MYFSIGVAIKDFFFAFFEFGSVDWRARKISSDDDIFLQKAIYYSHFIRSATVAAMEQQPATKDTKKQEVSLDAEDEFEEFEIEGRSLIHTHTHAY